MEAKNEPKGNDGTPRRRRRGKRQRSPVRDGLRDKERGKTIGIGRINTDERDTRRLNNIQIHEHENDHIMIKVRLHGKDTTVTINAMIDSGATEDFIDQELCQKHGIKTTEMGISRGIYLADGKESEMGPITHIAETTMEIGSQQEDAVFQVANLNNHKIVLGMPWLRQHSPIIDWANHKVTFDSERCTTW